jgi:2-keto-4-pentenoate hydratase/2-oxohepta-3-ene-1,7-dioic acid hydratase in catechol pathway
MKLVTFQQRPSQQPRVGAFIADGTSVIDLAAAATALGIESHPFSDMLTLLGAGPSGLKVAQLCLEHSAAESHLLHPLDTIQLLAPVPRPASIRDCMAFERHLINCMRTVVGKRFAPAVWLDRGLERLLGRGFLRPNRVWYQRPIYYKGNPASVIGPEATVEWPSFTKKLDYELEFGVFIGKSGRDIPVDRTREHIAGYCIFNDFSARDVQLEEMKGRLGPAKGKDFDTGNAMGPWLVTPDEVPDPYALEMIARVNGEEWSHGTSAGMRYSFEEMIAVISECETLVPGDFIGSGTVPTGCGLELDRWLKPGDVVELEVGGLGVLRNTIRANS